MKLRLTDGRIVPAEKDCTCLDTIHIGPHWLYIDNLRRVRNSRMLDTGNVRGFIQEEIPRLREKEYQMRMLDVAEVIPDEEL